MADQTEDAASSSSGDGCSSSSSGRPLTLHPHSAPCQVHPHYAPTRLAPPADAPSCGAGASCGQSATQRCASRLLKLPPPAPGSNQSKSPCGARSSGSVACAAWCDSGSSGARRRSSGSTVTPLSCSTLPPTCLHDEALDSNLLLHKGCRVCGAPHSQLAAAQPAVFGRHGPAHQQGAAACGGAGWAQQRRGSWRGVAPVLQQAALQPAPGCHHSAHRASMHAFTWVCAAGRWSRAWGSPPGGTAAARAAASAAPFWRARLPPQRRLPGHRWRFEGPAGDQAARPPAPAPAAACRHACGVAGAQRCCADMLSQLAVCRKL